MRAYLEWRTWFTFQHWSASGADGIYENSGIRSLVKPEVVWEIEGSFDLTTAQSKEAGVASTAWHRALLDLFARYDVLALPSAQVFPFRRRDPLAKSSDGKPMDTYHRWMEVVIGGTLPGLPVVNLPAGFDARGRPVGIQFLGRFGEDRKVLEFALAYERVMQGPSREPVRTERR